MLTKNSRLVVYQTHIFWSPNQLFLAAIAISVMTSTLVGLGVYVYLLNLAVGKILFASVAQSCVMAGIGINLV